MKKTIIKIFIALPVVFIFSCKQKKKESSIDISQLQHQCVHRLTDVIVYDIFTPPVASRIYAYCNHIFCFVAAVVFYQILLIEL